jgi:hypothetical protein
VILRQIADLLHRDLDIAAIELGRVAADDARNIEQISRPARDDLEDREILGRRKPYRSSEQLSRATVLVRR